MIRIVESSQIGKLLARKAARFTEAEAVVRPILEDVRNRATKLYSITHACSTGSIAGLRSFPLRN